jgi:hypothetical protein
MVCELLNYSSPLPTACCLLPTAFEGVRTERAPGRHGGPGQDVTVERKLVTLKVKQRGGNVYENKGSVFQGRGQSVNVIENKGSYALKAGMLLKRKEVGDRRYGVGGEEQVPDGGSQVVGGEEGLGADFGCRVSGGSSPPTKAGVYC